MEFNNDFDDGEEMDDEDFDVVEVDMSEENIDEMIAHLIELKEHKTSVQIPVADDLDLLINYAHDEDVGLEEDDEEFDDDDDEEDEDEEEEEELEGGV